MKKAGINFCLLLATVLSLNAQQTDSPFRKLSGLTGRYMGQKEPDVIPEKYNPGIVSADYRFYATCSFNPDFNEVSWTPNFKDPNCLHGGLMISRLENGVWTSPAEICFLDTTYNHRSPLYDYSGRRLYFQGHLKINQGWDQMEKFYFVEKTSYSWSKPVLLDSIFNKYAVHWQFSLDKDNNLYFGGDLRGSEHIGGIFISRYMNGKYREPELVFSNLDYDEAVFGPAISPDGSYILFTRIHPRGSTNPRIFSIYISFREGYNMWTKPMELGEKLKMDGNQPRVSPDGKYIFYIGNDGFCYWVSTKILDDLRPKK